MEVILKKYHKGLGEKGDIVTVKPGFGRNFLIPQGIAVLATESARKVQAENDRQAQHKIQHVLDQARKLADKIEALSLTIPTLAGETGKIFGSVTNTMVVNRLAEEGIEIDRKRVSFESDIKELGEYSVKVDIHREVKAALKVVVIAAEN
jgi:large subunit ribosomal protein L9